ncbi:hypothetical protein BH09PAT2_BH09PAT2_09710 [soil metagenome]
MNYTKKAILYILSFLITLSAGLFIGLYISKSSPTHESVDSNSHSKLFFQENEKYKYTNPLLDCELYTHNEIGFLQPFKYKIEALRDKLIKDKKLATHISIFFRDLNLGGSIGVDENEKFTPASLLKVPLMIAYLKLAEKDPSLLTKEIVFDESTDIHALEQNIKPTHAIQKGKKYTIDELIQFMIIDSDNNAQNLLYNNIKGSTLDAVYLDLGINIPGVKTPEDYMSVQEYASFFRILYNSTYLSRDMSEKALSYLTQVDYDAGIRAGLPADVVLANKFGERKLVYEADGHEVLQLHDCGIVYYTKRPYLLCIMTRGDSFKDLAKVASMISESVYKQISAIK